jgi:hypothetical protein
VIAELREQNGLMRSLLAKSGSASGFDLIKLAST